MEEHIAENKRLWDAMAPDWVEGGRQAWAQAAPAWGVWRRPEAELGLLREPLEGRDAIELGCGTGYVSAWVARAGARVVGVDQSTAQLATARMLHAQHGGDITWLEANAEDVPRPDASFDFAISEYGAAIWCDPEVWLREAWRLMRPGGALVFLGNHPLAMACTPPTGAAVERVLHRPLNGLRRLDWRDAPIDPGGIEFCRTLGDWFTLFRAIGWRVEDYREIFAPLEAEGTQFYCPADWGKNFPAEQVFWLRKPQT
ncbi:MAG: class I SAM-dependent methyltransferase [Shimia sp.]